MLKEHYTKYKGYNFQRFKDSRYWNLLDSSAQKSLEIVSSVLPFRTNGYVLDNLIDWSDIPGDPFFQLTMPQRGMLKCNDFDKLAQLKNSNVNEEAIRHTVKEIRLAMNPHPAGQVEHNTPTLHGKNLEGIQHKYSETVLFFPSAARSCHAYCTFCFRWPLIADKSEFRFANPKIEDLLDYLRIHQEVTDVLITGGDPMIMNSAMLERLISPLLSPELSHVQNIRIGTKSLAYWPMRFTTDKDADDIIRLFEHVIASGRHLALQAHMSHPRELDIPQAEEATRRIVSTGAAIRMQAPIIRRVNDDPDLWVDLWNKGVRLGAIPYYMFVERETGPKHYFEIPLVRTLDIYQQAFRNVSGLAKTCRGPSMSAFNGKVRIVDALDVADQKVFSLEYIQARDPELVGNLFFAKFDPTATWFNQLEPASAADADYFIHETEEEESVPLAG